MFLNILAALDGSSHSLKACEIAADLAVNYKANLILVTVVNPNYLPEELRRFVKSEHMQDTDASSLQFIASNILDEARDLLKGKKLTSVEKIIGEGFASDVLVEIAMEKKCDLIVLGTRGLSNFANVVLGSVSHRVTNTAACSVLIVR